MQKYVKQLNATFPVSLSQKSQVDSTDQPASSDPLLTESEYQAYQKKVAGLPPDSCVAESFSPGEIVWSTKYSSARVEREFSVDYQAEKAGISDINYEKKYGSKCYAIYVMEEVKDTGEMWANVGTGGFYGFSLAYDLGKLSHPRKVRS